PAESSFLSPVFSDFGLETPKNLDEGKKALRSKVMDLISRREIYASLLPPDLQVLRSFVISGNLHPAVHQALLTFREVGRVKQLLKSPLSPAPTPTKGKVSISQSSTPRKIDTLNMEFDGTSEEFIHDYAESFSEIDFFVKDAPSSLRPGTLLSFDIRSK